MSYRYLPFQPAHAPLAGKVKHTTKVKTVEVLPNGKLRTRVDYYINGTLVKNDTSNRRAVYGVHSEKPHL